MKKPNAGPYTNAPAPPETGAPSPFAVTGWPSPDRPAEGWTPAMWERGYPALLDFCRQVYAVAAAMHGEGEAVASLDFSNALPHNGATVRLMLADGAGVQITPARGSDTWAAPGDADRFRFQPDAPDGLTYADLRDLYLPKAEGAGTAARSRPPEHIARDVIAKTAPGARAYAEAVRVALARARTHDEAKAANLARVLDALGLQNEGDLQYLPGGIDVTVTSTGASIRTAYSLPIEDALDVLRALRPHIDGQRKK